MPLNSFSIGRDCQLVLMGPFGRVDLTYVTGFESRQITHSVRLDRLDGVPMGAELPKGWEGSFEVERGTSAVDDFFATTENAFFNQGSLPAGVVYQYIAEVDGSVSTYQYVGVVFKLANSGTWRGDASVRQKLEFYATQRQRL
jgi:hypothetical protein